MRIHHTIEIDAPADRVWQVVGPGFAELGTWARQVRASGAVDDGPRPDGAPCTGRTCTVAVAGFDHVAERITAYDPGDRRLTYLATSGMPGLVEKARNTWTVTQTGPGRCRLTSDGEVTVHGWLGRLARPGLGLVLRRLARTTLDDLRHHAETGTPSPQKVRADRRAAEPAGTRALVANATFSAVTGTALAVGAPVWAPHLGGPTHALLVATGAGVVAFGGAAARLARLGPTAPGSATFAALDALWVAGSAVLLATAGDHLTGAGVAAVVAVAAAVGGLAVLEARAAVRLRRGAATVRPGRGRVGRWTRRAARAHA